MQHHLYLDTRHHSTYHNLSDGIYPLLLWLLTTKVCEHVYGLCHQICPNFNELKSICMMRKLFVKLCEHLLFSKHSDGKSQASGYNTTYTDCHNVNLKVLSTYPSNRDLDHMVKHAYQEASNLWTALGHLPVLKWNIVRCYSDLKLNILTRNCIRSLRS